MFQQLQQVVATVDPNARLLDWQHMIGGSSAEIIALKLQKRSGKMVKWLVRQLKPRTLARDPKAAVKQFQIQQTVYNTGIPIPKPLAIDESRSILPTPYLLFDFIEGSPLYQRDLAPDQIAQIAAQLAAIHQTEIGQFAWAEAHDPTQVLLHGDFWPGNILWRNGKLVAVIDWEDAMLGDPLADFAITRFDVCFIFGRNALQTFTDSYLSLNPLDLSDLSKWDRHAANRFLNGLPAWAEDWPQLGRPDLTADFIRAEANWFKNARL